MVDFANQPLICGSAPHYYETTGSVIDKFKTVIRHNDLLPGPKTGRNLSSMQVVNWHVLYNLQHLSLYSYVKEYSRYEMDIKNHMATYGYYKNNPSSFVTFPNNNTSVIQKILEANRINITISKELRCGFSTLGLFILHKIKPLLLGFSVSKKDNYTHMYQKNYRNVDVGHDVETENLILDELHNKGLIDITFCKNPEKFTFLQKGDLNLV